MRDKLNSLAVFFIELLRFGIGKDKSIEVKPDGVLWSNVYKLAKFHSLDALCFHAASEEKIKTEDELIAEKWKAKYESSLITDVHQLAAWEDLKSEFEKEHIEYLPLKGINFKSLYPSSELRQMGDIDILYRKEKFNDVKRFLENLGYVFNVATENTNEQVFSRYDNVNVEMHSELMPKILSFTEYCDGVWNRISPCKNSEYCFEQRKEDEYIYFLIHSYKHFYGSGCGVRTVLDFYLFLQKYGKELDREYIKEEISKADAISVKRKSSDKRQKELKNFSATEDEASLADFEKLILSQTEKLFGNDKVEIDETGYKLITDGVYGNVKNSVNKKVSKMGKFGYIIARVFPPYAVMKNRYPLLSKCVILLPLFYAVRIVQTNYNNAKLQNELKAIRNADGDK